MTLKELPMSTHTFRKIIEGNCVYVDKTKEAYELAKKTSYFFLSRPRRFGKSLFLDTLQNIFEGNKELFKGLYIYDKWDFNDKYPVIKISWAEDVLDLQDLKEVALSVFDENRKRLGLNCYDKKPSEFFKKLIKEAYKKYNKPVVVLIDEYDKPILDVVEDIELAKKHREFIKKLYSILKDNDQYIRFAFFTGVSKFSKTSIFSGFNNLVDISLLPQYGNICGYTEEELNKYFKDYLKGVDMNKLKEWYNGYWFLKDRVYCPYSILNFINTGCDFDVYWFESGTPTFLVKLIQKNQETFFNIEKKAGNEIKGSIDIEDIQIHVLLYQTGYLTIKEVEKDGEWKKYILDYPNKEVRMSMGNLILNKIYKINQTLKENIQKKLYEGFINVDENKLREIFASHIASIPYNFYIKNDMRYLEGHYSSLIKSLIEGAGFETIVEDTTDIGRIDLTIKIGDKIYILEFKVLKNKEERGKALEQIKEKEYYKKYLNQGKNIYLAGFEVLVFKDNKRIVYVDVTTIDKLDKKIQEIKKEQKK